MSPKSNLFAYIQLHVAVLLYGLTAILGDLISLPATSLVWWRVLLACLSLFFLIGFGKDLLQVSRKQIFKLLGIGSVIAIHWVAFYGSIKYSNASIALVSMSLTTLFTALLEPIFFRHKLDGQKVFFGILVIPGMWLIVQYIESYLMIGIYIGIFSAFMAALFAVMNKTMVDQVDAFPMTFLEMLGVWIFLSIVYPLVPKQFFTPFLPSGIDWIYLLILSVLCTTLAFYLSLKALKVLSAFETNLVINLEPVYGIILAIVILKEHRELNTEFYLGVVIISLAVFLYPMTRKKRKHGSNNQ